MNLRSWIDPARTKIRAFFGGHQRPPQATPEAALAARQLVQQAKLTRRRSPKQRDTSIPRPPAHRVAHQRRKAGTVAPRLPRRRRPTKLARVIAQPVRIFGRRSFRCWAAMDVLGEEMVLRGAFAEYYGSPLASLQRFRVEQVDQAAGMAYVQFAGRVPS